MELAAEIHEVEQRIKVGDLRRAAARFARLLRAHPENVELYTALAQLRSALEIPDCGRRLLQEAALLDDPSAPAEVAPPDGYPFDSTCVDGNDSNAGSDTGCATSLETEDFTRFIERSEIGPGDTFSAAEEEIAGPHELSCQLDEPIQGSGYRITSGVGNSGAISNPQIAGVGVLFETPNALPPAIIVGPGADTLGSEAGWPHASLGADEFDDDAQDVSGVAPLDDVTALEGSAPFEFAEEAEDRSLDGFDWMALAVDFDDAAKSEDADVAQRLAVASLPERIDLWRLAEQRALGILRAVSRADEGNHAMDDWRLLTRVLLEGAAEARRADISISLRARKLEQLLVQGITIDELVAAHTCRELWVGHPEFHIDLGSSVLGEGWMYSAAAKSTLPWSDALGLVRMFGATEAEELRAIFLAMLERWTCHRSLQQRFSAFRAYVRYRIREVDAVLDREPELVFDEPGYDDYVDRWEEDCVRATALRSELEQLGLIPS